MRKPTVLNGTNNHYILGGSERYFFELGNLLGKHGHKVVPFCGASERNYPSDCANYFPPAVNTANPSVSDVFRFIYSRDARRCISRAIEEMQIEIAHLHIYHGKLTGSILKPLKDRGIPIVQTLHDYKQLCAVYTCVRNGQVCEDCHGRQYWKALVHRCNRGSLGRSAVSCAESYVAGMLGTRDNIDHFICVSEFMAAKMRSIGVAAERISTVHNFVDCERLQPATETGGYVLYFGRLDASKGLFTLLDAMRMNPDLRCIVAGTGPQGDALGHYAADNRIDNVEFAGFVSGEALAELVSGAICTVLPSESFENCPMAVLESLAYARPVIGTRIGGIPELINNGDDGYVIAPAATEELADALRKLAGNAEKARQMGQAGREKMLRDFSPSGHYAQIETVYQKLPGVTAW